MKLSKTMTLGFTAAVLALTMTACSSSSIAMNEQINSVLDAEGSSYTVTDFDAGSEKNIALINKAASAYASFKNSLTDTDTLESDLQDADADDIEEKVASAKSSNLSIKRRYEATYQLFESTGTVYELTNEDVSGGVSDSQAVAEYVASLLTGDAKVYVSDVINVPTLAEDGGYTGSSTPMRYVYIEYVK